VQKENASIERCKVPQRYLQRLGGESGERFGQDRLTIKSLAHAQVLQKANRMIKINSVAVHSKLMVEIDVKAIIWPYDNNNDNEEI